MAMHVYDLSTWNTVEGALGTLGHPQLPSNLKAIPKPSLHETLSQNKEKTRETKTNQTKKKRNQIDMDVNLLFSN